MISAQKKRHSSAVAGSIETLRKEGGKAGLAGGFEKQPNGRLVGSSVGWVDCFAELAPGLAERRPSRFDEDWIFSPK
jgi:hypothetical protein